jgi:hypothetical protein
VDCKFTVHFSTSFSTTRFLDAISGSQFLVGGRGFGERWPFGAVRVRIAPGRDRGGRGALRSLGNSDY